MILHDAATIARYQAAGWWDDRSTLDSLFRANVTAAPLQIALIDAPNRADFAPGPSRKLTYSQADEAADRLAAILLDAGVGKDSIVVAQWPNCVEIVIAYLAITRLGAIVSPVLLAYGERDIRRIVRHIRPAAYLTLNRFKDTHPAAAAARIVREEGLSTRVFALGDGGADVSSLGDITQGSVDRDALDAHLRTVPVGANEIVSLHWSSGTGGDPKCVPLTHNTWQANGGACIDASQIPQGARFLAPMHMVHTAGHAGFFLPWLGVCGTLALHQPFDIDLYVQQLEQERITHTVAAPAMLNSLLRSNALDHHDLSALKNIMCGSAPLDPWMIEGFRDRYGIEIVNAFGSTEGITLLSGPTITSDPHRRARYFPRFLGSPQRSATGGNWNVHIAAVAETCLRDEAGAKIVVPKVAGEFLCRSPAVFPGYLTPSGDLDRGDFDVDGFFSTGEIFQIAGSGEDADYYHYVDRLKDVINRGGQKIPVGEVEAAIQNHPHIVEACAIAVRDERLGEHMCAVVVPVRGESITLPGLVDHLRGEGISTFMLPEQIALVDALPRNPTGKVLKRVLVETIEARV